MFQFKNGSSILIAMLLFLWSMASIRQISAANSVASYSTRLLAKRDNVCDMSPDVPWLEPNRIGQACQVGVGDCLPICESHWNQDYQPITKVTAWASKDIVTGIMVDYVNSTSRIMGRDHPDQEASIEVDYATGERFKNVLTYTNKDNNELVHLIMRTTTDQKLDVGGDMRNLYGVQQPAGGGCLLGLLGSHDNKKIRELGLLFMRSRITSIEVGDVQYKQDPATLGDKGIKVVALQSSHFYNDREYRDDGNGTNGAVRWTCAGSATKTQSNHFKQSTTNTYGASASVSFEYDIIPEIAKVTAGVGFTYSHAKTSGTQMVTTDERTLTWQAMGDMVPGRGINCEVSVMEGKGDFEYSSQVKINLEDGTSYSYEEMGVLKQVTYSSVDVKIKDNDQADAGPGFERGVTTEL